MSWAERRKIELNDKVFEIVILWTLVWFGSSLSCLWVWINIYFRKEFRLTRSKISKSNQSRRVQFVRDNIFHSTCQRKLWCLCEIKKEKIEFQLKIVFFFVNAFDSHSLSSFFVSWTWTYLRKLPLHLFLFAHSFFNLEQLLLYLLLTLWRKKDKLKGFNRNPEESRKWTTFKWRIRRNGENLASNAFSQIENISWFRCLQITMISTTIYYAIPSRKGLNSANNTH